jgi:hypothetical protein
MAYCRNTSETFIKPITIINLLESSSKGMPSFLLHDSVFDSERYGKQENLALGEQILTTPVALHGALIGKHV